MQGICGLVQWLKKQRLAYGENMPRNNQFSGFFLPRKNKILPRKTLPKFLKNLPKKPQNFPSHWVQPMEKLASYSPQKIICERLQRDMTYFQGSWIQSHPHTSVSSSSNRPWTRWWILALPPPKASTSCHYNPVNYHGYPVQGGGVAGWTLWYLWQLIQYHLSIVSAVSLNQRTFLLLILLNNSCSETALLVFSDYGTNHPRSY